MSVTAGGTSEMAMETESPDTSGARDTGVPAPGQRVTVRHRPWVVTDVIRSTAASDDPARAAEAATTHLVKLSSLESDGRDEELRVVWELEQATDVHDQYDCLPPSTASTTRDGWTRSSTRSAGVPSPPPTSPRCRRRSAPASRSRTTSSTRWSGRCPCRGRTC